MSRVHDSKSTALDGPSRAPLAVEKHSPGVIERSYETENGVYGKSQRMKPQIFTDEINIDELRARMNPHASIYRTEFVPFFDRPHNENIVLHDKNEDHIGSINMRYPYESTSRALFQDWSGSLGGRSSSYSSNATKSSGCPFGVLSRMKIQSDTQYTNDYIAPSSSFPCTRSRTLSRDTFKYCQGGVPHIPSSRSRSRSIAPNSRK
jgi:hypothetical protein